MILYHGSNLEIIEIDFEKCKPYKDFGKGFYLTSIKEQAIRMAQNKAALFGGEAVVTVYDLDTGVFDVDTLQIRKFAMYPTIAWARFVVNNRNRNFNNYADVDCNIDSKYDIVIGPVADDAIAATIRRYMGEELDEEGLVRRLTYKALSDQYSFHSDKALTYLEKTGVLYE